MVKNYNNTDNIKNSNFKSLQQGKNFINYKKKISKTNYSLIEGYANVTDNLSSMQKIDEINSNNIKSNNELNELYKQFNNKIDEYQREKSRISNLTRQYLLRTGKSNISHGKNIETSDGIKGYVTNKGVFKRYPDDATYQSIVGNNKCPKSDDLVTIEQPLDGISNSMSPLVQGTDMVSNQSKVRYLRIEGKNQYLHIQELEVYSGEDNIAKISTEIQDDRANENETLNCSGTVYFGKKEGDNGEILSYDDMIKTPYKTLDNTGNVKCSNDTMGGDPLPGTKKQCICKVTKGGATVTTSSNGWNGQPSFIVDGEKDDNQPWPNSNHTQNGSNEWIEMDLKDNHIISRVVLYNRPDCCQDRLNGAKLKLLDSNRQQVYPTISLTGERLQEFMIRTSPKGQTCGSEGENVFVNKYPNVQDNQPTYLGCFADTSDRRMEWDGASYMSFDDCKQKAIDNKSTFFALQDTRADNLSACMISNDIVKSTSEGPAISKDFVWASNTNSSEQKTRYLYLDYDGNLMIKDSANNDEVVWQTNTGSTDDNNSYIKFKKTDYPGNDIEGKALTRSECRDYCNDNNECVGYNVSRSSNFCWFKKSLGNRSTTNSWNFFLKGRKTFLAMRNDGNMVLYTGHPRDGTRTKNRSVLWSSNTTDTSGKVIEAWKPDNNTLNKYKTNYLLPGQVLEGNQCISSTNGKRIALLQTDGNFVIYKAGSKCVEKDKFIGGASWTNSIYMLNNTKILSEEGKFVDGTPISDGQALYERISLGECMSKCESSNECNSFSFGKLSETDDHDTCYLYRNIPASTDGNKTMKSYQPNIKNPFLVGWKNAGKIGYVDENGILHELPEEFKTWENEYTLYSNTDSKYNDITSGTITDVSTISAIDQVKDLCNNNPNCAGFVFNPTNGRYWLKNENMYPVGSKTSNANGLNLYVRKRSVKANIGCSTEINEITSEEWENYQKGRPYDINTKCGLSSDLDNSKLNKLEDELEEVISKIGTKIKVLSSQNYDNSIQATKEAMEMEAKFKEIESLKKKILTLEVPSDSPDYLDTVLNKKDQKPLPSLFDYWFRGYTGSNDSALANDGSSTGAATSSGSASEPNVCENQAACMDDLTTFDQQVNIENFTTLTTPFDKYSEDLSVLTLGTLAIIGTMFAFTSCNKCK